MANVEKRSDSQATMPKVLGGLAVAAMVVVAGLVFVLARRLGWTLGWIYVGMVVATLTINLACLLRWNPELIRRRTSGVRTPTRGAGRRSRCPHPRRRTAAGGTRTP